MKVTRNAVLFAFAAGTAFGLLLWPVGESRSGLRPLDAAQFQDRLRQVPGTTQVDPRRTPIVEAVEKAGPSVVSIQVGVARQARGGIEFEKQSEGSGVIVDEEGLVITNFHVVRSVQEMPGLRVLIQTRDGDRYWSKVLSRSVENDLALLRIEVGDDKDVRFRAIQMGESASLMVGETLIAIGNPKGQANTVTAGVLSALHRDLTVASHFGAPGIQFKDLLQTDAAINPGNSGGALLDITGKLVGINTLIQSEAQNIGFAIPVDTVREVFEGELLAGSLPLSFGVSIREGDAGLTLHKVVPGGPGDRAGLRDGDALLVVGGREVKDRKDYTKALLASKAGDHITLRIRRGGDDQDVTVTPWTPQQVLLFRHTGMLLEGVDVEADAGLLQRIYETYRNRADLRYGLTALRVREVQPNSPAAELGIGRDDLLVGHRRQDFWGTTVSIPLRQGMPELLNLVESVQESSGDNGRRLAGAARAAASRSRSSGRPSATRPCSTARSRSVSAAGP
ncbi:MAG: trypsin-like peptidase domain-containing protein [Planctomycetota bacterium]